MFSNQCTTPITLLNLLNDIYSYNPSCTVNWRINPSLTAPVTSTGWCGLDVLTIPYTYGDLTLLISPGPFSPAGNYISAAFGLYTSSGIFASQGPYLVSYVEGSHPFSNAPGPDPNAIPFNRYIRFFMAYDANGLTIGYNNTIIAQLSDQSTLDSIFSGGDAQISLGSQNYIYYLIRNVDIFCESTDEPCGISSTTETSTTSSTEISSETSTTTNSITVTSTDILTTSITQSTTSTSTSISTQTTTSSITGTTSITKTETTLLTVTVALG
ncbi:hypothetical protein BB560_003003 [Smittium megazygosporum]|uniref:Uncharacterized protein n=1 Tax=Smittium megazygosporum TaxID=133381 RepID=A0A2T9ZDB2_9FUNG|nr:hypothetical protein BB560_003003 [Smittium megazygosporum]